MQRIHIVFCDILAPCRSFGFRRPVAELADAADLKSAELTLIRVQVPAGLLLNVRFGNDRGAKLALHGCQIGAGRK